MADSDLAERLKAAELRTALKRTARAVGTVSTMVETVPANEERTALRGIVAFALEYLEEDDALDVIGNSRHGWIIPDWRNAKPATT